MDRVASPIITNILLFLILISLGSIATKLTGLDGWVSSIYSDMVKETVVDDDYYPDDV